MSDMNQFREIHLALSVFALTRKVKSTRIIKEHKNLLEKQKTDLQKYTILNLPFVFANGRWQKKKKSDFRF